MIKIVDGENSQRPEQTLHQLTNISDTEVVHCI